jgi:hypothetical protein
MTVRPSTEKAFFASSCRYREIVFSFAPFFDSLQVIEKYVWVTMLAQGKIVITKKNRFKEHKPTSL